MDRKVKRKNYHYDKPPHQRWLYQLSDMPFFKFWLFLWAVIWLCIGLALLLVKSVLAIFK
jgi:hypothetical protein